MSQESELRELFDRWERQIWEEGRYDLIPECVTPIYTRHGGFVQSSFTVSYTPEEYGRVIATQRERFHMRFVLHDRAFAGDRVWSRYTVFRTDPDTGQQVTNAIIQIHRVEGGKLAETWIGQNGQGSAWPEIAKAEATPAQH
jgi:hypothetical protein